MTALEWLCLILCAWPVVALAFLIVVHGGRRKRYPTPPVTRQIGVDLAA